jgi:hypothetical protein
MVMFGMIALLVKLIKCEASGVGDTGDNHHERHLNFFSIK